MFQRELWRDRWLTWRFESRRTLGVPGLLGIALIATAMLIVATTPATDSEDITSKTRPAKRAGHASTGRPSAGPIALSTLPELFPTFGQSADDIASIIGFARESNLTLGSAEYQMGNAEPGAGFLHYQVLIPVKDQYASIRRFVALVLNSVPNAALREIHVERPAVDGEVLDARVRFELIYRRAGP
ncbi:hypothetical protein D1Y85_15625 [Paraburkholderia dinghuensis]|uniref:Uncharacterized protein n=2 Tax=Paraburkholderia dinghuensis TaxID=2305225 RepID=A0A3N6PTX2_9BURK|nr:hypothetical protein D1Y85_15625 [Paraburkholderia dinghuensis]